MPGGQNPFKFIEMALTEAKQKIEKMKSTPEILQQLPDNEKKKKFLKAENKLLRENLKRMSDNVNVLIDKMNKESQRPIKTVQKSSIQVQAGIGSNMSDGGYVDQTLNRRANTNMSVHSKQGRGSVGGGVSPQSIRVGAGIRGTVAEREV